ncbi:MAG TPA: hypothetical protein VK027_01405 [Chitinophagaceae bacterium]|nr:hypothetical protein [Chitinophagaceae bacterium]
MHPIVRAKEIKPVEFGAKAKKIQIGEISFIKYLNFNAFNERTRFTNSIHLVQQLTKSKIKVAGADAIYVTNANRKFATSQNIKTNFKFKDQEEKIEKCKINLSALFKKKKTRLERSFGKDKEHYHFRKIKTRIKTNKILWIFFEIHTFNALDIGRKMFKQLRTIA